MTKWISGEKITAQKLSNIYDVGSIVAFASSVNPNETQNGTWEQVKGRQLVETGMNDGGYFEKYSDGWFVTRKRHLFQSIAGFSGGTITTTLKETYTNNYFCKCSVENGGTNFASASIYARVNDDNKKSVICYLWNNSSSVIENVIVSWESCGYTSNESTIKYWKKVSNE